MFRKGQTFVSVCFFRLSLATTTGVEACPCLSSFNYDSKGARRIGLDIMPDSMPVCCIGKPFKVSRPWHGARAHAVTHKNQEKGGLGR